MEKSEILALARATLECEANSILGAVKKLDENFVRAVETIMSHKGKLLVCGVGKSGLVGAKITATLSSTGTPAVFMHACDAVHGDLGVYEPGDPTILISNSGSTVECLRLIPILKNFNSTIIAMVGNTDSPMGRDSDIVLDVSSHGEADPLGIVPTKFHDARHGNGRRARLRPDESPRLFQGGFRALSSRGTARQKPSPESRRRYAQGGGMRLRQSVLDNPRGCYRNDAKTARRGKRRGRFKQAYRTCHRR